MTIKIPDEPAFPRWSETELRQLTAGRFHVADPLQLRCEPIVKGGSVRTFHRFWLPDRHSIICMHFSRGKAENTFYSGISHFLEKNRAPVPEILAEDLDRDLIWLEDIGATDLHYYRFCPSDQRLELYRTVLSRLAAFQGIDPSAAGPLPTMMPGFDAQSYLWEQGYFATNCLGHVFNLPYDQLEEFSSCPGLYAMAEELGQVTPTFVHRDFQSTNVLMRNGDCWFIDFQGMRPGRPEYDVASLLYDPYVSLTRAERETLLEFWVSRRPERLGPYEHRIFQLAAIQRLMQALGAYGFLGCIRGDTRFLEFIRPALHSLAGVLDKMKDPPPLLQDLIETCLAHPDPAAPEKTLAAEA